jgi:phenylalanyl-tRNA synthetase beta chain
VRRTAKRLGLHTEASHRFERGTDPNGCAEVARHLTATVLALAGGAVSSAPADAYPRPLAPRTIELRPARTEAILGAPVTRDEQARLLSAIGLDAVDEGGGHIRVTVPTFRPDLTREIDLIEEVARLHGYDRVAPTLPRMVEPPGPMRDAAETRNDAARDALRGLGLDEVVSYAFVGPQHGRPFLDGELPHVRIANPMREEQSVMRRSLLPGLCLALQRNLARGSNEVRIFEVGAVFLPAGRELPDERWYAAGLLHGHGDGWLKPGAPLDFFDIKGVVEELVAALGHTARCEPLGEGEKAPGLHPRIAASVYVGAARIGVAGELHPDAARALGVEARPFVFELDLQALPAAATSRVGELPRFPSVTRDISFLVDERVTAAEIERAIDAEPDVLRVEVRVLEDYRDAKLPAGKKSMLWSITYRAADRTLTDEDVQPSHYSVLARLVKAFGAQLR